MAKQGSLSIAPGSGKGEAVILGRESPNLFELIQQKEKQKLAGETAKQKKAADVGKRFAKMMEYSPEAIRNPYNQYQQDQIKTRFLDPLKEVAKQGNLPTAEQEVSSTQARYEIDAATNQINESFDTWDAQIKEMSKGDERTNIYNTDVAHEYWGALHTEADEEDVFYDSRGQRLLKPELLDKDAIGGVYDVPDLYNVGNMAHNLSESLNANISSIIEEDYEGHTESSVKAKFWQLNDDGSIAVDEEGEMILNPSPELLNRTMKQKEWRIVIEDEKQDIAKEEGRDDVTNMDAFKKIMRPEAYFEEKSKKDISTRKTAESKKRDKEEYAKLRKKKIGLHQSGKNPEDFIGAKSGKWYVTESTWDSGRGGLNFVYDNGEEEFVPSEDFNRLNNLYNTLPGQEHVSDEILARIPAAETITPKAQVSEKINRDIDFIITSPIKKGQTNYKAGNFEKGRDILKSIPGISKVKYETQMTGPWGLQKKSLTGKVDLIIDGAPEEINLFTDEGAERVKELLIERKSDKYLTGGKDPLELGIKR